jgi:signal transduction histidine kinase
MSLRRKFGVLLALMGLAVLLIGAVSWWTFDSLRTEVREPIRSMTHVLLRLGDIKRDIEKLGEIASGTADAASAASFRAPSLMRHRAVSPETIDEFNRVLARVTGMIDDIRGERETAEEWALRTSKTSLQNMAQRVGTARTDGLAYLLAASRLPSSSEENPPLDDATRDALDGLRNKAAVDFLDIHELIERTEARLIVDAQSAIRSSDDQRVYLLVVLGSAMVIVVLTVAMGVTLIRRWVLMPVASLREATARIGRGEYTYRIPLAGETASDELVRLSAEVNQMAGMVKTMQDDRVEREKLAALGEMVRRLAHNLRNPLGGIRSLAELTIGELPMQGTHADLRENQARIITTVDRFEKWLTDLLTATRPMQIVPERTTVAQWLSGLVEAHRAHAQGSGVKLTLDASECPTEAVFDSRHLEHAVSAILSNAIAAASSPAARGKGGTGGTVTVRARYGGGTASRSEDGQSEDDCWTISIADQGPGVPPDLREKIFQPYFTTKPDGNGIGLAVALQVVKAHGGQIRLDSPWPASENGSGAAGGHPAHSAGTCFTIELPTNRPALAGEEVDMASIGLDGVPGGQNSRHRG